MKNKIATKVFDHIAKFDGVISPGLVAADLKLDLERVKKHIGSLVVMGLVYVTEDEHGVCLRLTDQALAERKMDEIIRNRPEKRP
jgi:hypothetical protein